MNKTLAERIAADPEWTRLANDVVRLTDVLSHPVSARDYQIAVHHYHIAKKAFDTYGK